MLLGTLGDAAAAAGKALILFVIAAVVFRFSQRRAYDPRPRA
jgi:uncharacterized membrane protein YtjA (UPF0391 family)